MSNGVKIRVLNVSIPQCGFKGLSWTTGKYMVRINIIFRCFLR
jgi:hypothetical protein